MFREALRGQKIVAQKHSLTTQGSNCFVQFINEINIFGKNFTLALSSLTDLKARRPNVSSAEHNVPFSERE